MAHSYYDPNEKGLKDAYANMLNEENEKGQEGCFATMLEGIDLMEECDQVKGQILTKSVQLNEMKKLIETDIESAINRETNVNLIDALGKISEAIECLDRAKNSCKAV
jgi:hypothetical protein